MNFTLYLITWDVVEAVLMGAESMVWTETHPYLWIPSLTMIKPILWLMRATIYAPFGFRDIRGW